MDARRTDDAMALLGEAFDRLMTLEMRRYGQHRALVDKLYAAAREKAGAPLCYAAARLLQRAVGRDGVVLMTVGAHDPVHMPYGETDGPPGLVALAKALVVGLAARPILVCEPFQVPGIEAAADAIGLPLAPIDISSDAPAGSLGLLIWPAERAEGERQVDDILAAWAVKAVVAVERMGPNADGVTYTSTGKVSQGVYAPLHRLFAAAKARGIASVGIGDNGNEVGMGTITEAVVAFKPNGRLLADATPVDVLIVANASNWGAYALAAMLHALTGTGQLHGAEQERAMLEACVLAGAVDGATGLREASVDGGSLLAQQAMVDLIREVAENHFKTRERAF